MLSGVPDGVVGAKGVVAVTDTGSTTTVKFTGGGGQPSSTKANGQLRFPLMLYVFATAMLEVMLALPAGLGVTGPPMADEVVLLKKLVDRPPGAPLSWKLVVSVNGVIWLVTTLGTAAV